MNLESVAVDRSTSPAGPCRGGCASPSVLVRAAIDATVAARIRIIRETRARDRPAADVGTAGDRHGLLDLPLSSMMGVMGGSLV